MKRRKRCCADEHLVSNIAAVRLEDGSLAPPPAAPGEKIQEYRELTICLSCGWEEDIWLKF